MGLRAKQKHLIGKATASGWAASCWLGGRALDDYDILEVLLMACIPRRDAKPIAKALQKQLGSLSGVLAAPPEALAKADGVGETVAAYLKAVAELISCAGRETTRQREVMSSWSARTEYVRRGIQRETPEQFRVLFLDRKNQLITDEMMGRGTVNRAPVHPREIVRRALEVQ